MFLIFVHLHVSCIYSFLLVTSSESLHNLVDPSRHLEGVFLAQKAGGAGGWKGAGQGEGCPQACWEEDTGTDPCWDLTPGVGWESGLEQ